MRAFKFMNFDPSKLNVTYTDDLGGVYSREVAKCFGVRHRDVVNEILRISKILPFTKADMFTWSPYRNTNGKTYPEWLMSPTALFLLVTNPTEKDIIHKLANVYAILNSRNLPIKENIEVLLNTYNKM